MVENYLLVDLENLKYVGVYLLYRLWVKYKNVLRELGWYYLFLFFWLFIDLEDKKVCWYYIDELSI